MDYSDSTIFGRIGVYAALLTANLSMHFLFKCPSYFMFMISGCSMELASAVIALYEERNYLLLISVIMKDLALVMFMGAIYQSFVGTMGVYGSQFSVWGPKRYSRVFGGLLSVSILLIISAGVAMEGRIGGLIVGHIILSTAMVVQIVTILVFVVIVVKYFSRVRKAKANGILGPVSETSKKEHTLSDISRRFMFRAHLGAGAMAALVILVMSSSQMIVLSRWTFSRFSCVDTVPMVISVVLLTVFNPAFAFKMAVKKEISPPCAPLA